MVATDYLDILVALVLALSSLTHGFQPTFSVDGISVTHRDIMQKAVLRKTAEVCRDIAAAQGKNFSLDIDDTLTVNKVQRACSVTPTSTDPLSSDMLQTALNSMFDSNAKVDFSMAMVGEYHFDNEAIQKGRDIITSGMSAVKINVKTGSFNAARDILGQICHTLQDFYSHSNWVELGKNIPYSALTEPDEPLQNLAGPQTPTCKSCQGGICDDNILPEVLSQNIITSGYFSTKSAAKPAGKCSRGGLNDLTSKTAPVGGISKDSVEADHGKFHKEAVTLAVDATLELLEDIRVAVGDKNFLRLMGLSQSPALCFVIDTSGSMGDDIASIRNLTAKIIDERRGTSLEPSEYILVPFNDPDFGPVTMTTDADKFKTIINALVPDGGGDFPDMSMSGLQLALTSAPPSSDIFLFTDAGAKDLYLKNAVTALIETTKSVVSFMITDVLSSRRRRRRAIGQSDVQPYRDLAQASGGQAIEVSKSQLSTATTVIEDSFLGAVVTVLQVAMNPGQPKNFTFNIDTSLSNMFIYITGASSLSFSLTSSTGVTQTSRNSSGPLASFTIIGNLHRISLNTVNQTGLWEIDVISNSPYTVKVTGQSSINFVYNIVDTHGGAQGEVRSMEGRPSGGNISLLVTVTGSDTVTAKEVTLFDSSRPTQVNGSIQSLRNSDFLVTFTGVPKGSYVVQLTGEETNSTSRALPTIFQRQTPTQIKTSSLSVTAQTDSLTMEPGSSVSVLFTITSEKIGTFSVQTNNNRKFPCTSPSSVSITASDEGKANGTIILTAPANATSGTVVSLTIDVQNADGTDINYTVLRFSVAAKVKDMSDPVCQIVNISGYCPADILLCGKVQWKISANLTSGINGTGITTITLRQGNGTLNTSTVAGEGGENITIVTYNSSCCSRTMQLVAIDAVGNVGECFVQARVFTTPVTNASPVTTPMFVTYTTPVNSSIHVTNTTYVTTPINGTNNTPVTTSINMTNTTYATTPLNVTNTSHITTPTHVTNTTPVTTPINVTNTTPVTTPAHVTITTPITTPIHGTGTTYVTTFINVTKTTYVTTPIHVTNTTPVTTTAHVTNSTYVTTPLNVTNTSHITTPMHVTNTTPVTTPINVTNTTPVTTPAHVTITTPITTPIHGTGTTYVTTSINVTNTTYVTTPINVTNTTPVTTPAHVTNTTYVTTPLNVTNTSHITTPTDVTNTTHVTTPIHVKNTTYVTTPIHVTNNTPVTTPTNVTNTTPIKTTVLETNTTTVTTPIHMNHTTYVTTPIHVTNTTAVTTPIHMNHTTYVTTPIHVTNTSPVTRPIHVKNTNYVTTPIHVTNTTPVTTPIHMNHTTYVTTPIHVTNTSPVTRPINVNNTNYVTTTIHVTNTTPVTTPINVTNTTPIKTPIHVTNTSPVTRPINVNNTNYVTTTIHVTNTTPVTTPKNVTNTTPIKTPIHVTNTTPVTTPIHLNHTTYVTTPINVTNTTAVTTPINVTNTTPIKTPIHVTNTTPVTTSIHMNHTTYITTPIHVTNTTPVTTTRNVTNTTPTKTHILVTNTTPITTLINVTNTTPVTTPIHVTNTTLVITPTQLTNTTPVTKPIHVTSTTPVTTSILMTSTTSVTTPKHVTSSTPVTTPILMTSTTPVTTPIHVTSTTPVTTSIHVTSTAPVTTPIYMTNTTRVTNSTLAPTLSVSLSLCIAAVVFLLWK